MSGWLRGFVRLGGAMLIVLVCPAGALYGQQSSPTPPPAVAAATLEKGRQHFVTYACYACHGYAGQGSDVGPRLDMNRLTLPAFTGYVRKPARRMPPYRTERQIPDTALAEIYAFLKSLPPPPDPKSIPLLRAD
jgi:mono/diheme cytochrome c family protein